MIGATTAFAASAAGPQNQTGLTAISFTDFTDSQSVREDYDLARLPHEVVSNEKKPMVSILEGCKGNKTSSAVALEELEHLDARELENAIPMEMTLISVSHDDERKFTPDRWAEILQLIEQGKVVWED